MTPSRPYLIRALYDWIVDNELTPYLLVDATVPEVDVPTGFVQDGKIVLNVSPRATNDLHLGNATIEFGARFSGKPIAVCVPTTAVLGIYAKENGHGMLFAEEGDDGAPTPPDDTPRPKLRVVK